MKKVFGVLMVTLLSILLGISVRWSRERNISLITSMTYTEGYTVGSKSV